MERMILLIDIKFCWKKENNFVETLKIMSCCKKFWYFSNWFERSTQLFW